MELLLSESRVKEWPGRAILATISCGHRQRGAGPRGSRCSCIVRVSGRCLRCRRVQTQCRFSCRFQRSSVQFGALHWQHCTAIRTWVRVAAGGGGRGCAVFDSSCRCWLLAAGRWMLRPPQISLQQRLGAGQPRALPHLTGADHAAWAGCSEQAPASLLLLLRQNPVRIAAAECRRPLTAPQSAQ